MKLYTCSKCNNLLYFENTLCLHCNSIVGFDISSVSMLTLSAEGNNQFTDITNTGTHWRFCANHTHNACNWLVPSNSIGQFCFACNLNRTIPFLGKPANLAEWQRIETAKHRLIYSLVRLGLPIEKKQGDAKAGLIFEFLEDGNPARKVITQHDDGRIELNINEADEVQRIKNQIELGEQYRTLLGHFRHEIGHYYWDVFYRNNEQASIAFRKVFGDERVDYDEALKKYYATKAHANWNQQYISQYATSHPWEDWAETWAHYLHLMDTLETAYAFNIVVDTSNALDKPEVKASIHTDPYTLENFDDIFPLWLPLSFAVNSLNRSMGHPDFYPFVIAPPVITKLKFIHEEIKARKKHSSAELKYN